MHNWISYFYYLSETNKWEQTPPLPQYPLSSPKHVLIVRQALWSLRAAFIPGELNDPWKSPWEHSLLGKRHRTWSRVASLSRSSDYYGSSTFPSVGWLHRFLTLLLVPYLPCCPALLLKKKGGKKETWTGSNKYKSINKVFVLDVINNTVNRFKG